MTLKPQHRRFVDEYMIDFNGTAAAERAGYSKKRAKVTASELMARDDVKAAIAEKQAGISQELGVSAQRVVAELAKLGFSNMLDFLKIGEDGQPYTDFSKLTRDQAAAISEITVETRTDREVGEDSESVAVPVRKVRFKLAEKRGPLDLLGRHLGLFKERLEVTGKDGKPIETKVINEADIVRRMALLFMKNPPKAKPND